MTITEKSHKHTEKVLGYSLPKLTEQEKTWKRYMSGGVWKNLMTGETHNYDELKKTIPSYFHKKCEMYNDYVYVFNKKYNNLCK